MADVPAHGSRSLAARRSGSGGNAANSPAKRRLDVLERDATPWLRRDPREDEPFTPRQRIANRFILGALSIIAAGTLANIATSYWLAAGETTARVEQERLLVHSQFLQGLRDATAGGATLEYTCGAAVGFGATTEGPGSRWYDMRKPCLKKWGVGQ